MFKQARLHNTKWIYSQYIVSFTVRSYLLDLKIFNANLTHYFFFLVSDGWSRGIEKYLKFDIFFTEKNVNRKLSKYLISQYDFYLKQKIMET